MTAILFGSIGTIVDTSELQRTSFNQAFAEHGLAWSWSRDVYTEMLSTSGGASRIAAFAESRGEEVDAAAVLASKSTIFQTAMDGADLIARPGVAETIRRARGDGVKVGLVTTTSHDNVNSMIGAVDNLDLGDFDVVLSRSDVDLPKPDAEAYIVAMGRLELSPSDCIAIEDNVDGVTSAIEAGLVCIAFPNQNTVDHDFTNAVLTIDAIEFDEAMKHLGST